MNDELKKYKLELHNFVDLELHRIALEILPEKEKQLLSEVDLLDSVFIIEKFIYGLIYPQKWRIEYASTFNRPEEKVQLKRLKQIEEFLSNGDERINHHSFNYLPKSSRRFLKANRTDDKRRLVVDFSNSFFGIKHLHLNQKHDDNLLFYANDEDTIYFIRIGTHNELYMKENVQVIVHEFPDLQRKLKISPLPDLHSGDYEPSVDEIKKTWEAGATTLLKIDGVLYTGIPQTFSNHSNSNIVTVQNLIFQLENQLEQIFNHLHKQSMKTDLRLLRAKSRLSLKRGYICYRERISGQEYQIRTLFLQTISEIINLLPSS